jgi:hypothetical protein
LFPDSAEIKTLMTEKPWALFALLGTFWKNYVDDRDTLRVHEFAHHEIHADTLTRADTLDSAASVLTVEPFRTQQWWAVQLRESELVTEPNLVVYGSGRTFGDGTVYGQVERHSYGWILPSTIRGVGLVVDRFENPGTVFDISNSSFDAQTSVLRFDENPFSTVEARLLYNSDGSAVTYTGTDGSIKQDREIVLWLRNVSFDQRDTFLRFGSIIKVSGSSSPAYQATVEAIWRALVMGPSMDVLWRGLLASTGLQYAAGDEVVESVGLDSENLVVTTSKTVYKGHSAAVAVVSAGDTLRAGQQIFDTVELIDVSDGLPDDLHGLAGVVLNQDLVDGNVVVTAPNTPSTWTVIQDVVTGRPEFRFELIGAPADVETFWSAVHARGLQGTTVGEATGAQAGDPVNPAEFFVTNFFNGKLLIILLKPQHFLAQESGFLDRIRTLLPAGVLVLTQIALGDTSDTFAVDGTVDTVSVCSAVSATDTVNTNSGVGPLARDYQPSVWNA